MKDIVKFISEAKDTKPLLNQLYNVVCDDTHNSELKNLNTNGVINAIKDWIGEDEPCDLTPDIFKKYLKDMKNVHFMGQFSKNIVVMK